jgi:hypothetical protein
MMIFSFDIQYSLFDILQLKELPRSLNALIRNNDKRNKLSVPLTAGFERIQNFETCKNKN